MNGCFITFEGLDGAGKSTQIELLAKYLRSKGYKVVATEAPRGTSVGRAIYQLITHPKASSDPLVQAHLFAAARTELAQKVIVPALEAGAIVLCDRYIDSTYAYQEALPDLDSFTISAINTVINTCIPAPHIDLTYFLNVPPALAEERHMERGDSVDTKNAEFYERVYRNYLRRMTNVFERAEIIDATNSVEKTQKRIQELTRFTLKRIDSTRLAKRNRGA